MSQPARRPSAKKYTSYKNLLCCGLYSTLKTGSDKISTVKFAISSGALFAARQSVQPAAICEVIIITEIANSERMPLYFCSGNCTEKHPGCTTIWNTNMGSVYLRMVNGLMQPEELQSICR